MGDYFLVARLLSAFLSFLKSRKYIAQWWIHRSLHMHKWMVLCIHPEHWGCIFHRSIWSLIRHYTHCTKMTASLVPSEDEDFLLSASQRGFRHLLTLSITQWTNIQARGSPANINISPQVPIILIKRIKCENVVSSLKIIITFTNDNATQL